MAATLIPGPAEAAGAIHVWSDRHGGSGTDEARDLMVDADGNVLIIGYTTSSTVDLGGGPLDPRGGLDILAAKFSPDGEHVWSRRLGGAGFEVGRAITVAPSGNVIMAVSTAGGLDLGGGSLPSFGGLDVALAAFDADGNHLWSRSIGGSAHDEAEALATDADGNVLIAGYTRSSSIDFGGGPLAGGSSRDIFLAAYSPAGTHLWSHRFGSFFDEAAVAVAADSNGNVSIAGWTRSPPFDLGGDVLASHGGDDMILASYSPTGDHRWSKRLGGGSTDQIQSLAIDGADHLVINGYGASTEIDLGGGPLIGAEDDATDDIIVGKFSADGEHIWSSRFGGLDDDDRGWSVSTDTSGNVYIGGHSWSAGIDLGGGVLSGDGSCTDAVMAKLDTNGQHIWSQRFAVDGCDRIDLIGADPSGAAVISFRAGGDVDIGGGTLTSAGGTDIILGKFAQDDTAPVSTLDPDPVVTVAPLPVSPLSGTVTDDLAGVDTVTVTFTSLASGRDTVRSAALSCDPERRSCTFSASPVWGGVYEVTVVARDRAGNIEGPGASAIVVVAGFPEV